MVIPLVLLYEGCNDYLSNLAQFHYDETTTNLPRWTCVVFHAAWYRVNTVMISFVVTLNTAVIIVPQFVLANLGIAWCNAFSKDEWSTWEDIGKINYCYLCLFTLGTLAPLGSIVTPAGWMYNTFGCQDRIAHFRSKIY